MAKQKNYTDKQIENKYTKSCSKQRKYQNKLDNNPFMNERQENRLQEKIAKEKDKQSILRRLASKPSFNSSTANTTIKTDIKVAKNQVNINKPKGAKNK